MSKGYYTVFVGKDKQYYFNLKADNHEIILRSEGYKSKNGAINGVNSVQENCSDENNYIEKIAKNGKYFFALKARNNETIGVSQLYSSKQAMKNGIKSVMVNGKSKIIKGTDETLYEIHVNGSQYDVKPGVYLGSEILQLGGYNGPRFCLFLLITNGRKEIRQSEQIKIDDCLNFQVIRND